MNKIKYKIVQYCMKHGYKLGPFLLKREGGKKVELGIPVSVISVTDRLVYYCQKNVLEKRNVKVPNVY